jgi:hypothetical protein
MSCVVTLCLTMKCTIPAARFKPVRTRIWRFYRYSRCIKTASISSFNFHLLYSQSSLINSKKTFPLFTFLLLDFVCCSSVNPADTEQVKPIASICTSKTLAVVLVGLVIGSVQADKYLFPR